MPYRRRESASRTWLWFFMAFPLALVVVLLWQRRKLQSQDAFLPIVRRLPVHRQTRYTEPDSIPIDLRAETEAVPPDAAVEAVEQDQKQPAVQAEPDDLEIIEGIGPAIARLLSEQGITTFQQLALTPVERLDEILVANKLRRLANPTTWPEQASLASDGNWEDLEQFQATLKGGRRE